MANEFYAIATSLANLAALTAAGAGNLTTEPHPTEFHEAFTEVDVAGDGTPIELGFAWCTWRWNTPLSAAEWNETMTFTGSASHVTVWIRTRTNQISGAGATATYEYKNYQAIMYRPTGKSTPHYRYEDVEVKFTQLQEV